MLEQVCGHIHNYFTDEEDIRAGEWTVKDGAIELDFLKEGQYFRVVGSVFNDGVHQYPAWDMTDENFTGEIWPMKPPRAFTRLCEEIEAWQEKYGAAAASPYSSESVIGVYSYTKATGDGGGSGTTAPTWESMFRPRLNQWRKLR